MKSSDERIVIDTNVLISAFLFPGSLPSLCVSTALRCGVLLASTETLAELSSVLLRPKFNSLFPMEFRLRALVDFRKTLEVLQVHEHIQACRDPKDDKFLSLAVSGNADVIITGDEDLLTLNPFRGITIVSPPVYLAL